jgi:hypothetical protein
MHVEAMNWSGKAVRRQACANGATGLMTVRWTSTGERMFIRVRARE